MDISRKVISVVTGSAGCRHANVGYVNILSRSRLVVRISALTLLRLGFHGRTIAAFEVVGVEGFAGATAVMLVPRVAVAPATERLLGVVGDTAATGVVVFAFGEVTVAANLLVVVVAEVTATRVEVFLGT